jgi:hypothetical protein
MYVKSVRGENIEIAAKIPGTEIAVSPGGITVVPK